MKKYLLCLIAGLISTSVLAAELQMPPSALSTESPNKDRIIMVAEFDDLADTVRGLPGNNPVEMTVEKLTSDRATIGLAGPAGGKKLCVVQSVSNPTFVAGGTCVSAQNAPSTITVATFRNANGIPSDVRDVPRGDFYRENNMLTVSSTDGALYFNCRMDDGRNTGTCRMVSSK